MNYINIIWTFLFAVLQTLIFIVNFIIWSFLNEKPLGQQTLLDAVTKDLAVGMQCTISIVFAKKIWWTNSESLFSVYDSWLVLLLLPLPIWSCIMTTDKPAKFRIPYSYQQTYCHAAKFKSLPHYLLIIRAYLTQSLVGLNQLCIMACFKKWVIQQLVVYF